VALPLLLRRRGLLGLGAGLLFLPGRAAAGSATAAALAPGRGGAARLTLQLEGPQRWALFAERDPPRLRLHLPGIAWRAPRRLAGAGPVREARFDAAGDSVILELAGPVALRRAGASDGVLTLEIAPGPAAGFARLAARGALAGGTAEASRPVVVIDPGHGGRDPGAIGAGGSLEKRITLAAALELRRQLLTAGRCRPVLTRTRDVFVPLAERVEVARRQEGALFLSLHADSAPGARGASVYTLAENASDELSAGLARRENGADRAGGLRLPSVPPEVGRILLSLVRQETRAGSAKLARLAVAELGEAVPLLPNTHREAAFVVLKSPETPSALVEMGFLSHPQDEAALGRPEYRARVAAALARSVHLWLGQGRVARAG
jgi:N-acetylmuramoyl-L-alanine amidase